MWHKFFITVLVFALETALEVLKGLASVTAAPIIVALRKRAKRKANTDCA